jgi:hypothetical protein
MHMKKELLYAFMLLTALISCEKQSTCTGTSGTIVIIEPQCRFRMTKVLFVPENTTDTMAIDSLPLQFQKPNLKVCADIEPYTDLALCPCCGGKRVKIKRVNEQN